MAPDSNQQHKTHSPLERMVRKQACWILLVISFLVSYGCDSNQTDPNTSQQTAPAPPPKTESKLTWEEQLAKVSSGEWTSIITPEETVTSAQFRELAGVADKVTKIELQDTDLRPEDFEILPQLTQLSFFRYESPVGDEAMKQIGLCQSLRILNLPGGTFTDVGLASISSLNSLELLRISSPNVTDASMPEVAQLPSLRFIHLIGVPITDQGLKAFQGKTELESFYLDGGQVTDAGLKALLDSIPDLHLHRDQLHLPDDPRGADHHTP